LAEGKPTIFTRRGFNWTARFRSIADAGRTIRANHLILDGEIVVPGRAAGDFGALQADLARSAQIACDTMSSTCFTSTGSTCALRHSQRASARWPS
jgi:ATP-dependent DNA ligase